MRVAIIGAGIAGLAVALKLSSAEAVIFERASRVGWRQHCTGVVSTLTAARLRALSFVENVYDRMTIVSPVATLHLEAGKPFACRIMRCEHEEELARIIEASGHEIRLGHEVLDVQDRGHYVEVVYRSRGTTRREAYDYAVIAEGYPGKLSSRCGFSPRVETLHGLQFELELSPALPSDAVSALLVVLGVDGGEGFAWLVPLSRRRALLGVATASRHPLTLLERLEVLLAKHAGVHARRCKLFGGVVLRGYPRRIKLGRLFALGDANATVKSLSGGGLYPISEVADYVAKAIDRGDQSKPAVLGVLRRQYRVTKTVLMLLRRAPRISMLSDLKSLRLEVTPVTYDRHDVFAAKALLKAFRAVGMRR